MIPAAGQRQIQLPSLTSTALPVLVANIGSIVVAILINALLQSRPIEATTVRNLNLRELLVVSLTSWVPATILALMLKTAGYTLAPLVGMIGATFLLHRCLPGVWPSVSLTGYFMLAATFGGEVNGSGVASWAWVVASEPSVTVWAIATVLFCLGFAAQIARPAWSVDN